MLLVTLRSVSDPRRVLVNLDSMTYACEVSVETGTPMTRIHFRGSVNSVEVKETPHEILELARGAEAMRVSRMQEVHRDDPRAALIERLLGVGPEKEKKP